METARHKFRWRISTEMPISYEIVETFDLLNPENREMLLLPYGDESRSCRLVVVDENVERIYGAAIRRYFERNEVEIQLLVLPSGEQHKEMDLVLEVLSSLNKVRALRRGAPPIAIGGGVLSDIVGLAAALYRRGIPYVRVPTTLLGQVDVSVAAKTGVNFEGYRNRLGSYSPPPRTLIDRSFLRSLDRRNLGNGMGEILKMALIKDAELFRLLEQHGADLIRHHFQFGEVADEVIRRSIQGMAEELEWNLWERNLQRSVDYGHSFSPLVEMRALPQLLHGEAVTLDCVFSAILAEQRGLLTEADIDRIVTVATSLDLPVSHPYFCDAELLAEALADTVRHRNGNQNLPVLSQIGAVVFLNDVRPAELAAAARRMADLPGGYLPQDLLPTGAHS